MVSLKATYTHIQVTDSKCKLGIHNGADDYNEYKHFVLPHSIRLEWLIVQMKANSTHIQVT